MLREIERKEKPLKLREFSEALQIPVVEAQRYTTLLTHVGILTRRDCGSCGHSKGWSRGHKAEKYLKHWGVRDAPSDQV
jgi:hypothetical protein